MNIGQPFQNKSTYANDVAGGLERLGGWVRGRAAGGGGRARA